MQNAAQTRGIKGLFGLNTGVLRQPARSRSELKRFSNATQSNLSGQSTEL